MDLGELHGMPRVTSGKVPPTRPTAREVSASPAREAPRASSKRTVVSPPEQAEDTGRHHEKEMKARWKGLKNSTKVWNNLSAAEEFEMGLLHPQLARELDTLPSEVLMARAAKEMVLVSFPTHDAGRLITFMDYRVKQLQEELDALKSRGGPEAVVEAEKRTSELREELEKIKREKDEEVLRREALEKELQEIRGYLGDTQQLLREARTRARRMDDELLQTVKDLESA
ncbi:hypothetical protein BHE74_00056032 [Ensete ventricosum]|nr:hypothetical protein BHE74_00056032 [Ensete ventricosum]